MSEESKGKILKLRQELETYEKSYRLDNLSLISDFDYDMLMRELIALENAYPEYEDANSISKRIGSDLAKGFKKIEHLSPMLSLDNVFSYEEFCDFDTRLKKVLGVSEDLEYCIEPKIDGVGLSLLYKDGLLLQALTRGDGKVGEDITANIGIIEGIVSRLNTENPPELIEIRGEVFMQAKEFERLNKLREDEGKSLYANPRNLTSGTVKLLDKKELVKRKLNAIFYFVGASKGFELDKQSDLGSILHSWNLSPLNYSKTALGAKAAYAKILELDEERVKFPFDTDGAVIKLNNTSLWEQAGFTVKFPRWAVAYKYKSQRAITTIRDITLQVGRTGVLTPVAELEKVFLSGSSVSRATLHNAEEIKRKDIRIGDKVLIEKAGEIIPAVVEVVEKDKRSEESKDFVFPENCPVCGTKLLRDDGEVYWRCPNYDCSEQVKRRLEHFASKPCMDIDGLGFANVEKLFDAKLITKPSDIYYLTKEKLLGLDKFQEKSAQNLIEAIKESKSKELYRLIFALGIFNVGEKIARDLARHFKTMQTLSVASKEELSAIDGIGEIVAISIRQYFSHEDNLSMINTLKELGLNFKAEEANSAILAGKIFVITGTLPTLKRTQAKDLIEKNGGVTSGSVSKNTTYLLCGENAGSKLEQAKKHNMQVLSEEEFLGIISKNTQEEVLEEVEEVSKEVLQTKQADQQLDLGL